MNEFDDVPRYKKKSKKKSRPKANHKHLQESCVFEYDGIYFDRERGVMPKKQLTIGTYCPICGKIGSLYDERWMQDINYTPDYKKWKNRWTEEAIREFDEKTRTPPLFRVKGLFPKFIDEFKN